MRLINRIATQGQRWRVLEHFKRHFALVVGESYVRSSSEGWAETDLKDVMWRAAENAPLFIEAFYEGCETLRKGDPGWVVPDVDVLNELLNKHDIGYHVRPPDLVLRQEQPELVPIPREPPPVSERAIELYQQSLRRAEELLSDGRNREAVQELLWLLETVATAFRGVETELGTIEGKYFNEIARELRAKRRGTVLERVVEWVNSLYGYLSSPTGGGVRHGVDLREGVALGGAEARLFCNLIRSYLGYLIEEYRRLSGRGE